MNRRKSKFSLYRASSFTSKLEDSLLYGKNKKRKMIDTKYYDNIKFPGEDKQANEGSIVMGEEEAPKDIQFNSSFDLLKEVEIRVLNYINEYSDSRVINLEDIPLDVELSQLGKY